MVCISGRNWVGLKQSRWCPHGEDRTLPPGCTGRSSTQKAPSRPEHPSGHQSQGPFTGISLVQGGPARVAGAERLLTKPSEHGPMWAHGQLLHNSGLALLKMVQLKGALEVVLSSPPQPSHLPASFPASWQQAHGGTLSCGLDISAWGAEDQTSVSQRPHIVPLPGAVTHISPPTPRAVSSQMPRWEAQECERGDVEPSTVGADPFYSRHQKPSFII